MYSHAVSKRVADLNMECGVPIELISSFAERTPDGYFCAIIRIKIAGHEYTQKGRGDSPESACIHAINVALMRSPLRLEWEV